MHLRRRAGCVAFPNERAKTVQQEAEQPLSFEKHPWVASRLPIQA